MRIVGVSENIGKISLASGRGASSRFPNVVHRHGAGTVCICVESGTGHQTLFSGPQSYFIKIIGGLNVGEWVIVCRRWGAASAPQENQNLRLTASCVGGERGLAGAAGDILFNRPLYCVHEVVAGFHIGEDIARHGRSGSNAVVVNGGIFHRVVTEPDFDFFSLFLASGVICVFQIGGTPNAPIHIGATHPEIVTLVRPVQPLNAPNPISVTLLGMVTLINSM